MTIIQNAPDLPRPLIPHRTSAWLLATFVMFCVPALWAQGSDWNDEKLLQVPSGDVRESSHGKNLVKYSEGSTSAAVSENKNTWVDRWLQRVDQARSEQPHTVAPLVTTHVLLVQQFRFDSLHQQAPDSVSNFGGGKGVEIIPNTRMEIQVGLPPYVLHSAPNVPNGFADVTMFLKFRAYSAPEGKGDYFVGLFLGGSFPSASRPNGLRHTVWAPMIAAAKGWGPFNVQSTLSASLPQSGTNVLGRQLLFNNAFQLRVAKVFWPQVETNSTFFVDGPHSGSQQTFLTPGLVVGSFKIFQRLRFSPGIGVQIATTHFHLYDHRWVWSMRFPF